MSRPMAKLGVSMVVLGVASLALGHCEIPCGIYEDAARLETLAEHITTIEKSMKKIGELSQQDEKNYNQIARWVLNKEQHAHEIQHIVSQYFLTQRLKPVGEDNAAAHRRYLQQLRLLHEILVYAMKSKQTTDLAQVVKLRELLSSFTKAYLVDG